MVLAAEATEAGSGSASGHEHSSNLWKDYPSNLVNQSLDLCGDRARQINKNQRQNTGNLSKKDFRVHAAAFEADSNVSLQLFGDDAGLLAFLYQAATRNLPVFIATETERDLSKRTANGEDDEPSYQCISLSATMKIASLFELHPMVLGAAHTEWGIKQQLIRSATAKGKGKIGAHDRDVFYCCPSGWRIPGIPTVLKGVSYVEYMFASYLRITHIGQRPFTMFFNIPSFEVKELFPVWLQEQKMSLTSRPLLLDQHCLLSTNIGMLVKSLSYYEWSAGLNGTLRIQDHLQLENPSLERTLDATTQSIARSSFWTSNLSIMRPILNGLAGLMCALPIESDVDHEYLGHGDIEPGTDKVQCTQMHNWSNNILEDLAIATERLESLSRKMAFAQETIMQIIAIRQSTSTNKNTEEMKRLANANHELAQVVAELTHHTQRDSTLMRYLAEITMVFLPLTAISTFFSMSFFAVDTSTTDPYPFVAIGKIWIFVIVFVLTSACTWGSWWHRTRHLHHLAEEHKVKTRGDAGEKTGSPSNVHLEQQVTQLLAEAERLRPTTSDHDAESIKSSGSNFEEAAQRRHEQWIKATVPILEALSINRNRN